MSKKNKKKQEQENEQKVNPYFERCTEGIELEDGLWLQEGDCANCPIEIKEKCKLGEVLEEPEMISSENTEAMEEIIKSGDLPIAENKCPFCKELSEKRAELERKLVKRNEEIAFFTEELRTARKQVGV